MGTRTPNPAPAPFGRAAGMSLLELLVASAMLLIVIGAALHVMITGQTAFNRQNLVSTLQDRGRLLLEEIAREISAANAESIVIKNFNTELYFQIPVDADGDGDVLQADNMTIEFGAMYGLKPLPGYYVRYRFLWTGKMPCEYCDRCDYNGNGRIDAYFRQGEIERSIVNNPDTPAAVPGSITKFARDVMVRYSPQNGDVNGDYTNDPLFMRISGFDPAGNPIEDMMNGNQIFVNAWLARNDSKNQPAIVNARTAFTLRNIEQ